MDITTLIAMIIIFAVVYQGLGLLSENTKGFRSNLGNRWATGPVVKLETRKTASFGSKLGFNKVIAQQKWIKEPIELLLIRSGHPMGWKLEDVIFYKEVVSVLSVFFLWQYGVENPIFWFLGIVGGFYAPDYFLKMKGTERRATISKLLPGFVDLLALCMESGLDLLAAVDRILEKLKESPLKEELQTLLQENQLGTPRKEALRNLAYRIDLKELQSLTSIIIQSEELGTSLAMVLRNYADDMRSRRIMMAEEIAGKAPVKILFPNNNDQNGYLAIRIF